MSKDIKKFNNKNLYVEKEEDDGVFRIPRNKRIIDPNIREDFLKLLGVKRCEPEKGKELTDDNPFYNYEFYMIPGKDGKKHLNSPVIAERYYEDKETEERFATDNATYFFQYQDFMVVSNYLKKDEAVTAKEDVIFRSNHTVANEKRKGSWASSVIANVVKTWLSSDLKEYNAENKAIIILEYMKQKYTFEELRKIFILENEIDSGKHTFEIVRENGEIEIDEKIGALNFEDDDEGLR